MYDVNVGIPYIYQIMLSDIKYIYIYILCNGRMEQNTIIQNTIII